MGDLFSFVSACGADDFSLRPLCDVGRLIFAQLSYCDFLPAMPFAPCPLPQAIRAMLAAAPSPDASEERFAFQRSDDQRLLSLLLHAPRYARIMFIDFTRLLCPDGQQFAALTLAISVSGSEGAFVRQMNLRARALGLTQTHFANPHGLDSGENYSTALDLAHLAQAALQNAQLRAVVSTKTAVCAGRTLTNHNKLLWRYDGCIGVKTGYTRHAGRILVSAAERDGRMLIAVTISDPDDWRDHTALLDYGFAVLGRDTPVYPQNRRIVWKNDCKKFWRAVQMSRAAKRRN